MSECGGGGGSSSTCQRKDSIQKVHTQEAQTSATKIYRLCGIEWIYLYDTCIYLGKDRTTHDGDCQTLNKKGGAMQT